VADVELLPCSVEHELRADAAIIRSWIDVANGPINREALADRLDRYANAAAELTAEVEALRAEVAEAREFRDKIANAIGNEQLRRFIEKHGEPVPLTIRMQEAEARAERLLAEVERVTCELMDAITRADKLEEALRELVDVFSESGMYDEEVFAKARAALGQEDDQ